MINSIISFTFYLKNLLLSFYFNLNVIKVSQNISSILNPAIAVAEKAAISCYGWVGKGKEKFLSAQDKTSGLTESIDISYGMEGLRNYITKVSQNPFDRAMKQLYEVRNEAENPRNSDNLSQLNGILLKAERDLLIVNEKGVEADSY